MLVRVGEVGGGQGQRRMRLVIEKAPEPLEMNQDVEMPASVSSSIVFDFAHIGCSQDKAAELAEEWICMTSPDGFTFLVKGKVAVVSGTLKNSLTSGYRFVSLHALSALKPHLGD